MHIHYIYFKSAPTLLAAVRLLPLIELTLSTRSVLLIYCPDLALDYSRRAVRHMIRDGLPLFVVHQLLVLHFQRLFNYLVFKNHKLLRRITAFHIFNIYTSINYDFIRVLQ